MGFCRGIVLLAAALLVQSLAVRASYDSTELRPAGYRVVAPHHELEQTDVFVAGQGGYHTYRIPSIIVTPKGTVLAFCEGRKHGRGDSGDIDLVLKRSSDGGNTWSEQQVVWDDGENTCGNPCPVVDRDTGNIWLLLTHNLGKDTEAQIIDQASQGTRTCWVSKSTDDGVTWDKPIEITRDVKLPEWTWYATGPGVGIQAKTGRLVVPCDNMVAGTKNQQSHVIYSDDHGHSWKPGGVVGPKCDESQVVELADGRLMLNMRSYRGNNRRLVATSSDGGITWSEPVADETLIEPVCQASILRVPGARGVPSCILFSNPASTKREKLTVRASFDEARTWPAEQRLHDGPAAYSCLAVLPDSSIGCLYECGEESPYERIRLARFALDSIKSHAATQAKTGKSPAERFRTEIEQAQSLGQAIYTDDMLAAWATDALFAKKILPGDRRIHGWVTRRIDDAWTVSFIGLVQENECELYAVRFATFSSKAAKVEKRQQPVPLDPDLLAMFRARQSAANSPDFKPATERYNSVVLPGSLIGESGWLVYLLAATTTPGEWVVGGHFRMNVSDDGQSVNRTELLSKSFLKIPPPDETDGKEAIAPFVTHLITDYPIETHVYLTLLHKKPLIVRTASGVWRVEDGVIHLQYEVTKP